MVASPLHRYMEAYSNSMWASEPPPLPEIPSINRFSISSDLSWREETVTTIKFTLDNIFEYTLTIKADQINKERKSYSKPRYGISITSAPYLFPDHTCCLIYYHVEYKLD
jgi:hypothetical protein